MDPKSTVVLQEVISKLQGLLGGSGTTSSGPKQANIPQFDANFAKFVQKSKTLSPEIQKLTDIYSTAVTYMKKILGFSVSSKKYSPQQQKKLQQKFQNLLKDTDQVQRKNAQYIDHSRAIKQLLSVPFWVFVSTPQFLIKGAIESGDFNAIKFQRKKNLDNNEWYKFLQISLKSLQKFVLEGYPMGISFNSSGSDNWGLIIDGSSSPQNNPPAQIKQQNKGKNLQEAPKAPVQLAKKAKKRQFLGQTYNITNFQDQTIELKVGQLEMKHGIYVQNCKNVKLTIFPKFKSIVISKCEHLVLDVTTIVSGIQVIDSKQTTLIIRGATPSISVQKSNVTKIVLNQDNLACDIVSSKASQVTVTYDKGQGNEQKPYMIGEQLITKWNPIKKAFQTSIYDKFL